MDCNEDVFRAINHLQKEVDELKRQVNHILKSPGMLFKEEWMDGYDTARALNISQRHLRTLRLTGKLIFARLHKKIYYKVSSIRSYLEENATRGPQQKLQNTKP